VSKANPHTIVVLNTGSAVTMPWLDKVQGVVEGWYPGQQDGTAIANLLFGDSNFSGKLPVTFPKSLKDVPAASSERWPGTDKGMEYSEGLDVGYRWYDDKKVEPLFPFGYGLSYTKFAYSGLKVDGGSDGNATVTATVKNTGGTAGSEVAQLYVSNPSSDGEPPQQLKGYQKVALKAGESATVKFALTPRDLAHWDSDGKKWTTTAGDYGLSVGDSSRDKDALTGKLTVN
jgi:beta-glucosidase